jgi:hypothetical protein
MKRFDPSFLIVCFVLLFLGSLGYLYAQSAVESREESTSPIRKMIVTWTSATDGSVSHTITGVNGEIYRVTTDPSATAPTDNYDITLTDEDGVDVLVGLGANRDTATTESISPGIAVTNVPSLR